MNTGFGRSLILLGAILMILGALLSVRAHIPWLGKLPGDIVIKKENFSFYFPLATCLLLSVVLSVVFYLFRK